MSCSQQFILCTWIRKSNIFSVTLKFLSMLLLQLIFSTWNFSSNAFYPSKALCIRCIFSHGMCCFVYYFAGCFFFFTGVTFGNRTLLTYSHKKPLISICIVCDILWSKICVVEFWLEIKSLSLFVIVPFHSHKIFRFFIFVWLKTRNRSHKLLLNCTLTNSKYSNICTTIL